MRRGTLARPGAVCGRPSSWSTSSWRLPPLTSSTSSSGDDNAAPSRTLVEEECVAIQCAGVSSAGTARCIPGACDSSDSCAAFGLSDSTRCHVSPVFIDSQDTIISNKRAKAKASLDEMTLRTSSISDIFQNGNFTRSDSLSNTPRGEGICAPRPKTALARSSSYQALHSALARLYRLDDFTTERLGQGFFSEVYKVRHRVTGDIMVLKMNKIVSNRHNMLREVELMNRLHHNNILSYYGVCIHEGQVHALTEYINGGSLDAMLQNRTVEMSWFERVALAADTARGMAYLHCQGVFHRDLTSKNVLIKESVSSGGRRKREAVVADFGLAAPIPKDKSVRMRQVGSPYWMAPEVIRGVWYDHRADVFSFGIILCEMIARCEADPDVLPRTDNFGVHYHAFSRMCQNDCPPYFLQMAFQCCQIDPGTRPSFEVLTKNFESMLSRLIGHRGTSAHRKQKVCHRRSLSDDCLMLGRASSSDDSSGGSQGCSTAPPLVPSSAAAVAEVGRTPQEVVERMGAADPYFTPSTATVNPFTRVKLPAPSHLTVQDGARFCYSLPDPLPAKQHGRPRPPQLHGSHSSLCPAHDGRPAAMRQDGGGSGAPVVHLAAAVKRRGSGESGFFSVGDMDRTGTPELWCSYSELSCPSLALEDEERSWVTDSSEDLCGQDEPDAQETDIKAIVEFFERGYGSLRTGPLIRPRFSPRSPASPPHCHVWGSKGRPSTKVGLRHVTSRRDTFRVKDRPKLYITEGTVRAKRDIFEAK